MTFDVYLYSEDSDEAVCDGADHVLPDFSHDYKEAVAAAQLAVSSGEWARAIVAYDPDNVHEIYDTTAGWLDGRFEFDLADVGEPLPPVAPLGKRQRRSPLAERALGAV